jgi:hypothetical protein
VLNGENRTASMVGRPMEQLNEKTNFELCDLELNFFKLFDELNFVDLKK